MMQRENTSDLSIIKWSLGVHRKSSNIGAWGDSGRAPLLLTITKKLLDYFQRVKNAKVAKIEPQLAYAAYVYGMSKKWSFVARTKLLLTYQNIYRNLSIIYSMPAALKHPSTQAQ